MKPPLICTFFLLISLSITLQTSKFRSQFTISSKYFDMKGVHVLLVSLFGIPIVWSISHFFGWPNFFWYTKYFFFGIPNIFLVDQNFFLVDQISFWYTKIFFCYPKFFLVDQKMRNWSNNWYTKETDQKYMDAASIKRTVLLAFQGLFFSKIRYI